MSIVEQAKTELSAINFGEDDSRVMIEILEKFFDQWDSGGAVSVAQPVLMRLIAGKPLSPLTGNSDEWMEVTPRLRQNIRCSTVFNDITTGNSYNVDTPGRPTITFPYWPEEAQVREPVCEVET